MSTTSSMCRPGTLYSDVLLGRKAIQDPKNAIDKLRKTQSVPLVTSLNFDKKLRTHISKSPRKSTIKSKKFLIKCIKAKSGCNTNSSSKLLNKARIFTNKITNSAANNIFLFNNNNKNTKETGLMQNQIIPKVSESDTTLKCNNLKHDYPNIDQLLDILKTKVSCQLDDDSIYCLQNDLNLFKDSNIKLNWEFDSEICGAEIRSIHDVCLYSESPYCSFSDCNNYRSLEEKAVRFLENSLKEN